MYIIGNMNYINDIIQELYLINNNRNNSSHNNFSDAAFIFNVNK